LHTPPGDAKILRVKNALRLPALFLLFFILLCLLLTGLILLELRVSSSSENPRILQTLVAGRLLPTLREVLPASVLIALVLVLFPMYQRPGNRVFAFLLPLAAAFAVLVVGWQLLSAVKSPALPAPTPGRYLLPGRIQDAAGTVLYVESLDGAHLRGVVQFDRDSSSARLRYAPTAAVGLLGARLVVRGEDLALTAPAQPAYEPLVRHDQGLGDRLLGGFLADFRRLNQELAERYRASRGGFYFSCFALLLSFFAAGLFFRISRWPLANVLLAFLVMRGFLYLFRLLREGLAGELGKLLPSPALLEYLPEVALLIVGVILLLVDLLFYPSGLSRGEARRA
jgi:hypothetical protein